MCAMATCTVENMTIADVDGKTFHLFIDDDKDMPAACGEATMDIRLSREVATEFGLIACKLCFNDPYCC